MIGGSLDSACANCCVVVDDNADQSGGGDDDNSDGNADVAAQATVSAGLAAMLSIVLS